MRKTYTAVIVTALSLTVCMGTSLLLSACGSSQTGTVSQTHPSGFPPNGNPMYDQSAIITKALAKLVANLTITSKQRDAVVATVKKSLPKPVAKGTPKPGSGVPPSVMARGRNISKMFAKMLDKLVANGTITKAQRAAILKAHNSEIRRGGGPGNRPPYPMR